MKYQAKNMFLGVAFFSAMLAGCASTDTDSSGQEGADKVSTYTESSDSMNDSYNSQDMANLETVFYFEFDQATLTVKARKALDAQIVRLKRLPALCVWKVMLMSAAPVSTTSPWASVVRFLLLITWQLTVFHATV